MKWKKASEHKPHHYWEGFVRREKSKGGFWAQWDASWGKFRNSNINMSGISPANHEWLDQDEQDEGWVPGSEGLKLVATERKRQIEVEGWDNLHDADHDKMQLTGAAACYAANAINKKCGGPISRFQYNFPPEMNFLVNNGDRGDRKLDKGGWRDGWPWEAQWDKRDKHDVLRSLVISAALIVAEIDNIVNPPATT